MCAMGRWLAACMMSSLITTITHHWNYRTACTRWIVFTATKWQRKRKPRYDFCHAVRNFTTFYVHSRMNEVTVVDSARNLGVIIDSHLSLDAHVAAICRSGYYQLRQLRPVTGSLSPDAAKTLVQTFISGWCYFPSVETEIKCNNSLFSVCTDGNLYAYIRYFPSVGMEIYS